MVTIYSLLCAFLPCLIYLIFKDRKERKFYLIFILLFILYIRMVYTVTGAGGLTDIIYAPEGRINKPNVNLIPFSTGINFSFYLNIIMCIPLGFLLPFINCERKTHFPFGRWDISDQILDCKIKLLDKNIRF